LIIFSLEQIFYKIRYSTRANHGFVTSSFKKKKKKKISLKINM